MEDKYRFGILINNVDGRYQNLILKGFEEYSKTHPINFSFFIGRSINSPNEAELFYNSIYNLSKSDNIDGIISISGSIGNYLNLSDLNQYFSIFKPKPMVSIGAVIDGIPSIVTDNTGGMFQVVDHIINSHGIDRIGFITGSDTNLESIERYEGYIKALNKNNIKLNKDLVFKGDFSYNSYRFIIDKIVVNNNLICDALVCSNDEMALGITNELYRMGFKSPKDYLITGFDNILDSNYTTPPLTTVHQPLIDQAYTACSLLNKIINKLNVPMINKIDTRLIIRESCGCNEFRPIYNRKNKDIDNLDRNIIIETIKNEFINEKGIIDEITKLVSNLIDNILLDIHSFRKEPIFLYALSDWLSITERWNYYFDIWYKILNKCQSVILDYFHNIQEKNYINELFKRGYSELVLKNTKNLSKKLNNTEILVYMLREVTDKLNLCSSFEEISSVIQQEFVKFDIKNSYLVLHKNGVLINDNNFANMVLHPNYNFNAMDILPHTLTRHVDYFILPLLYTTHHYGYIVFEKSSFEAIVYESLSKEVSKALFNICKNKQIENRIYNLEGNKSRLDSIFEMIPMLIIDTDLNTTILYKNNYQNSELTRKGESIKTLRAVIPKDDLLVVESLKWKIKDKNTKLSYPGIRIIDENNNRYISVAQISGLFNDNEELTGFRWFIFDSIPLIKDTVLPDSSFYIEKNISKREKDVIKYILQGQSIKNIASELFISESTVKGHMSRIYSKFKVSNKTELVYEIQKYQVDKHGYSNYLFSVMNSLLSIEK
ncbi:MAG: substrate-binding domain-containing protein [Spirochaetales bacterium]|nr:substrate-binding domain-containing protein [Spirochaetales bacterium]